MKKIFGLIAALVLISGCDDGDMTFKTFNFTGAVTTCTQFDNVYVKNNTTELLILELNGTPLTNIQSATDAGGNYIADTITISGSNKITYRNYSGTVLPAAVCNDVPPASPTVVEEWTGSGTILVITTRNTPVAGQPQAYSHSITLLDVSFTNGGETVRIQNNDFGSTTTNLDFNFAFVPGPLAACTAGGTIYSVDNTEALVFRFNPAIFTNEAGIQDIPVDTNNLPILRVFNTGVATGNICGGDGPQISETQRWNGTQGTIHIVTTYDAISNNYKHSIYFKDLKLYKAGSTSANTESYSPSTNSTLNGVDYYYYGDYQP